jgi:hypothetical protein
MVGLLDDLFGRQVLVSGSGGAADAEQAGDLGYLQARLGVEQEVTEQARRVVVSALPLAEAVGGLEQRLLLRRQPLDGELCLFQPGSEGGRRNRHDTASRASGQW